jgi:hypothetical protein
VPVASGSKFENLFDLPPCPAMGKWADARRI